MQRSSTYLRELSAITSAVAKWRHYLLGSKFFIHTDQQSLRNLMHQTIQTPEQQYYLTKLLGYNYEILYKPGKANTAADALSKNPTHMDPITFIAISVPTFLIIEDIKKEQNATTEISNMAQNNPDWTIKDKVYLFQGKIYIPSHSTLKKTLLKEYHNSPEGGHGGIHKTFMRINTNFHWKV